jgi:hypothetical protein
MVMILDMADEINEKGRMKNELPHLTLKKSK